MLRGAGHRDFSAAHVAALLRMGDTASVVSSGPHHAVSPDTFAAGPPTVNLSPPITSRARRPVSRSTM